MNDDIFNNWKSNPKWKPVEVLNDAIYIKKGTLFTLMEYRQGKKEEFHSVPYVVKTTQYLQWALLTDIFLSLGRGEYILGNKIVEIKFQSWSSYCWFYYQLNNE